MTMTRRKKGIYLILLFLFCFSGLIILTNAQDSNHFFCGSSWGDASGNCDDREHCPEGTDDECSTEGHICFGGTTCDVKLGHGNKFKYANVDYNDISNTRFCGNGWNAAIKSCSIETHCPSGFSDECPKGLSCYGGLKCNIQDLYEEEAEKKEEAGNAPLNSIPRDDERRNMFCGFNWADASKKCNVWCPGGQDEDCPGSEGCFGGTGCYADLVPTANPMFKPSNPPSTLPPAPYDDPANNRFCGAGWGMAIENCSFETHCPSGSSDDCPAGHSCHGGLPSPQCNIVDLWEKIKNANKPPEPSPSPTMQPIFEDDPTNTKFCGKSWAEAEGNCSLDTHCPDDRCPSGSICYGGTSCNSFLMTKKPTEAPTLRPTDEPTTGPPTLSPSPTESPMIPISPTSTPTSEGPTKEVIPAGDMRHSFWCGKDWADVNKNCFEPCTSGQDTECSDSTMKCIAFTNCRPTQKPTRQPTKKPSPPTTPQPSLRPTEKLATFTSKSPTYVPTYAPTVLESEVPVSSAPSRKPILDVMTNEPTASSLAIDEIVTDEVNTSLPTNRPTPVPTSKPTSRPSFKPTLQVSELQTSSPTAKESSLVTLDQAPPPSTISTIGRILVAAKIDINEKVLLTQDSTSGKESPTQRYQFDGFINALGVISKGHLGSGYFYLGQSDENVNYGLVNVALLISQAVVESIKYDVCDEVSWEKDVFGRYPLANSCGQGRYSGVTHTSYDAANQCTDEESFLACPVDPSMTATAESKVIWAGAPPPLECFPATNDEGTGAWDSTLSCPAEGCSYYDGQVKGNIDPNSIPSSNSFGRNNVEGCCWWGRGVIPRGSAGTCMIGKLNYYLGKRAHDDGRSSARYKEVDFCKDPGAICSGFYKDVVKNAEVRWMMGILYWIRNVQTYKKDGFSFMERLYQFVDSGFSDPPDFFDDVSRIVSRGCHQKSCGNVISGTERKRTFDDIILYFGNAQAELSSSKQTLSPTNVPSAKEPINAAKPTTRPTTQKPTSRTTLIPTTSKSDSTSQPTTSQVTTKPSDYTTHLSKEELNRRMNFSNNYCATSLEEVESKCATTLRTCNFGQPLCSVGQACFGNILCSAAAQFITQLEENNPINCGDACLRPLTFQECESGSKMGAFVSLPICSDVRVGEFCKSSGECGGVVNVVSNCFEGQHVFMRVDTCNSSQNSITSTGGETTASKTQNQTANIPILDNSISTIPTEPTENQRAEPSSVLKSWWKHEFNEGSIRTPTCLLHIFCTCAAMFVLLR
mmetsp:Transcript_12609/g.25139  ORF Transcript_12609/g.25139 Transcript_12609/m.25139 type:complete len:1258 (+) Transcript_12609:175-3948(+)